MRGPVGNSINLRYGSSVSGSTIQMDASVFVGCRTRASFRPSGDQASKPLAKPPPGACGMLIFTGCPNALINATLTFGSPLVEGLKYAIRSRVGLGAGSTAAPAVGTRLTCPSAVEMVHSPGQSPAPALYTIWRLSDDQLNLPRGATSASRDTQRLRELVALNHATAFGSCTYVLKTMARVSGSSATATSTRLYENSAQTAIAWFSATVAPAKPTTAGIREPTPRPRL